jgi:two-component system, cell cycle sensor histidine kinase and response regulator CckA
MLKVSDTGSGMSREIQDRIFEPFFTTKGVGKGTGLGLSTAHGIVTQSGGRLDVSSEPGLGTIFTMYLPVVAAAEAGVGLNLHEKHSSSAHPDAGVVLVVEDESAVRTVARRILEHAGYTVFTASDGPEALSLHAQHATSIDLVLTDMVMPTMSGVAVATALHAHHPQLPVVIMSGLANDAMARDVDGDLMTVLRKPFTPEALIQRVGEALQSSQVLSASPAFQMVGGSAGSQRPFSGIMG